MDFQTPILLQCNVFLPSCICSYDNAKLVHAACHLNLWTKQHLNTLGNLSNP
jgi:hypothetical protein